MNSSAPEENFGNFSPHFLAYINSFNLSDENKRRVWRKWNSIQKSTDYETIEFISLVIFLFVVTIGVIGNCTIIFIQISKSFLDFTYFDLGIIYEPFTFFWELQRSYFYSIPCHLKYTTSASMTFDSSNSPFQTYKSVPLKIRSIELAFKYDRSWFIYRTQNSKQDL